MAYQDEGQSIDSNLKPPRGVNPPPPPPGGGSEGLIDALPSEGLTGSFWSQAPVGVYLLVKGRFLTVNSLFERLTGYAQEELVGNEAMALVLPEDRQAVRANAIAMLKGQRLQPYEFRIRHKNGEVRWMAEAVASVKHRGEPATLGCFMADLTERKQADERLGRADRALHVLSECNQWLVRANNEADLLDGICRRIVEHAGYRLAWVGYAQDDAEKRIVPVARAGYEEGYLDGITASWGDNEWGRGPAGRAIRTGKSSIIHNILDAPDFAPWQERARARGYGSIIALPLQDAERVFGVLCIYAAEPDALDHEEVKLLSELADDLAYGIATLRTRSEQERTEQALRAEHAFRQAIEESMLAGVMAVDLEGRQIYVNPAFCRMVGWSAEELVGTLPPRPYWPPEEHENINAVLQAVLAGDAPQKPVELRFMRRSGERFPVLALLSRLIGPQGQPVGHLITIYDITERKRLQDQIRESETLYRSLVENVPVGVGITAPDGRILAFNDAILASGGYTREDIDKIGSVADLYFDPNERVQVLAEAAVQGFVRQRELRLRRKDGAPYLALLSLNPVVYKGERCWQATVEDITERKAAEERLRESQRRLQTLVDTAPDIVAFLSLDGVITSLNPAFHDLTGFPSSEWVGRSFVDLLHPDDMPVAMEALRRTMAGETVGPMLTVRIRRATGGYLLGEAVGGLLVQGDEIGGAFALVRDVTERVRAEEAQRASDELIRAVVSSTPIVLWAVDTDGVFTLSEGKGLEALGLRPGEVVGRSVFDVYRDVPQIGSEIRRALAGEEFESIVRIGSLRFETSYSPQRDNEGRLVGILGISTDVTARLQFQEALRQAAQGWRTTFDAIDSPILLLDSERRVLRCNRATTSLFGKPFPEIVGHHCWECTQGTSEACPFPRVRESRRREASLSDHFHDGRCYDVAVDPILDEKGAVVGGVCIHRDVTERRIAEDALEESVRKLQAAMESTVQAMAMTCEMRDPYTAGHQKRVAQLAIDIASEIGLVEERIVGLRMAGLLHDLGKIAIPAEILTRPGGLTALERELVETHCQAGFDILKPIGFPWPVAEIVLQHHERLDGSGYPNKLRGEQIMLEARILAVADMIEAMASHRPYRPALGTGAALEELSRGRGLLYDTDVVDACLRVFDQGFSFPLGQRLENLPL